MEIIPQALLEKIETLTRNCSSDEAKETAIEVMAELRGITRKQIFEEQHKPLPDTDLIEQLAKDLAQYDEERSGLYTEDATQKFLINKVLKEYSPLVKVHYKNVIIHEEQLF